MTSPRWLRRKRKLINKMEEMKKIGKMYKAVILQSNSKQVTVKFETTEGEFDSDRYIKYFLSLYSMITKSYKQIADNTADRKTKKYLLYEAPIVILIDLTEYILTEWRTLGKSVVLEANTVRFDK